MKVIEKSKIKTHRNYVLLLLTIYLYSRISNSFLALPRQRNQHHAQNQPYFPSRHPPSLRLQAIHRSGHGNARGGQSLKENSGRWPARGLQGDFLYKVDTRGVNEST